MDFINPPHVAETLLKSSSTTSSVSDDGDQKCSKEHQIATTHYNCLKINQKVHCSQGVTEPRSQIVKNCQNNIRQEIIFSENVESFTSELTTCLETENTNRKTESVFGLYHFVSDLNEKAQPN